MLGYRLLHPDLVREKISSFPLGFENTEASICLGSFFSSKKGAFCHSRCCDVGHVPKVAGEMCLHTAELVGGSVGDARYACETS